MGNELNDIEKMALSMNDDNYMMKCRYAIGIMKTKLNVIGEQLSAQNGREVIKGITDRIKTPESICAKLKKKGYESSFKMAQDKLNDIIGIRVVCLFQDDLYRIAELIKKQQDITLIKEKDYIKTPKNNGYMSLHLIIDIPICFEDMQEIKRIEIQLRTAAMDFWSVLDYQLFYKKALKGADRVAKELKEYAELIAGVDKKMLRLRNEIENI